MKFGAVILARMESSRLPGKCLRPLPSGLTLIELITRQLRWIECIQSIVVATTAAAADDPIQQHCESIGVDCYRGSSLNVAQRFTAAAMSSPGVVYALRVNADSPIIDRSLISEGVLIARESNCDLVTNLRPRTYPYGITLQLARVSSMVRLLETSRTLSQLEHITPILDEISSADKCINIRYPNEMPWARGITIDTLDDWKSISRLPSLSACLAEEYDWRTDRELIGFLSGL